MSQQSGGGVAAQRASQGQRVADELAHGVAHRRGRSTRQVVVDLEQVRLDVRVRRVEDEVGVRPARHLRHVLVPIDDFGDKDDLVLQHLDDVLVLGVHVVVGAGLGQLAVDGPHLPRHALGLEGPASAAALEELQADGAASRARIGPAQQRREVGDLAPHAAPERLGLAAHVREVDEVAVHVDVADGADGVALLVVVGELAAGAVEQYRVEDASDHLVHLPALHRQFERDSACVHVAGVSVPTQQCEPLLST